MYRYHEGQYQPLETSLTGKDGEYYYYSAQTPGFSAFIIVGQPGIETGEEGIAEAGIAEEGIAEPIIAEETETAPKKGIPGFGILAGVGGILIAFFIRKK